MKCDKTIALFFIALSVMSSASSQSSPMNFNRIDVIRADAPSLAAYGANAVGVRTVKVVNPAQIDVVKIDPAAEKPKDWPRYDRALTLEVWYPAAAGASGPTTLKAILRDGKTEVDLYGRAVRDAAPNKGSAHPLVIISHGYPGNRFLLSPLAENIASKGYVVAAIDHTDSTYDALLTPAAVRSFASTLVNRPLDQIGTLNAIAKLSADSSSFLNGLVNTNNSAIIGYSMGGYGALISAGAAVTQTAVDSKTVPVVVAHGLLGMHSMGNANYKSVVDPRVKTIVAFAPWGLSRGVFDAAGLKNIKTPTLYVAGSIDDVSGYENGIRGIWQAASGADRSLLTFDLANHNAGAPMPAPVEAQYVDPKTNATMANHYIDAVWDNVRMNNVSQHFVSAWLAKHLKADAAMDSFLNAEYKGFPPRTAKGLRFESLKAGQ